MPAVLMLFKATLMEKQLFIDISCLGGGKCESVQFIEIAVNFMMFLKKSQR
jgi:hypothetical protein